MLYLKIIISSSHLDFPLCYHNFVFTFKSIIHFELIFVKTVRSVSRFMFFSVCECPVPTAFAKLIFFSFLHCFVFDFVKVQWSVLVWDNFVSSLFCFIDLFVYSFVNTTVS